MKVFRVYGEYAYDGPDMDEMKLFFKEDDAREYADKLEEDPFYREVVIEETVVE